MRSNNSPTVLQNSMFSKEDTVFFKGIAILMIVIHNYVHIIPGFLIENEFLFHVKNLAAFKQHLLTFLPNSVFGGLFSFLGHYGVQIFFFFSAYGLTIQYSKFTGSNLKFVVARLKKVYFLLLFAIIFCSLFFEMIGISFGIIGTLARGAILASTLNSFTTLSMFSGPFWFFAAIIQFYILFPFLYRLVAKFSKKNCYIPLVISYIFLFIAYFLLDNLPVKLMGESFNLAVFRNIIGHLPELLLGIIMAHFKFKSFNFLTLLGALILFIASQMTEFLFPFSFLAMTILLLPLISGLQNISNDYFKRTIRYVGQISMILFIVNGPFRSLSWFDVNPDLKFERIFLYLFILIIVSHLLYLLYKYLGERLRI